VFNRARWRLVAFYCAILAIIFVGFGITVFTLFQQNMYVDVDRSLGNETSLFQAYFGNNATSAGNPCLIRRLSNLPTVDQSGPAPDWTVVNCRGRAVQSNAFYRNGIYAHGIAEALRNRASIATVTHDDHYWRVATLPIYQRAIPTLPVAGAIQFYGPVDGQIDQLHRLESVLVGGAVVGLILAGSAGFFLAERTLSPIRVAFDRQRQFIADASHELRTPLTLIRSSAEMVTQTAANLEAEDAELLEDVISEVDRMSRLVSDLLTLARVDNSQIDLKEAPVDISQVARDAHADVQPLASKKDLSSNLSAGEPEIVAGDDLRLRQLLLILLDNAIKYTPAGGEVRTEVVRQNGHVAVTVSDSGPGIPESAIPHVFERFYRADGARTHEGGGAGLGLSIADWIVRAHGGKIQIKNRPQGGTCVTVVLPLATMEKPGPRATSPPKPRVHA